jgi:tetratricopeptide (TPR) repeat protein
MIPYRPRSPPFGASRGFRRKPAQPRGSAARLARFLLVAALACCEVPSIGTGQVSPSLGAEPDSETALVTLAVNEKLAKLKLKPPNIEFTAKKATYARAAIKHGEYGDAHRIVVAVLNSSHLENWRFEPFREFINGITDVNDPNFEARLNDWVAQERDDAIPVIVRAQYYYDMGWSKRGHAFANETQASQLTAFSEDMKKALADADTAIRLDDSNPYSFLLKLRILQGFGPSENFLRAFAEAIAKHSGYYPLYDLVLATLQPRWGGTPEIMYRFVEQYAENAPQYGPFKLLYVSLYRYLLSSASVSCNNLRSDFDKMRACVAEYMGKNITHQLEQQVESALQLYDHSDQHQFNVAIGDVLFDMFGSYGGEVYTGAVLQLAATAMHSDTALKPDKPSPNNYIIDEVAAASWYQKRFYDNALTKYQEALNDIELASFPNQDEKDLAISYIYNDLSNTSNTLHQYLDEIAYERAAISFGGSTGHEHYICYAYYQLKQYTEAIKWCTIAIESADNLWASYWRGMSLIGLNQKEEALRDLRIVADSEDNFRTSAAIRMSVLYDDLNDFHGSLEVLKKYQFLFDPKTQNKNDLAVSYNNRCYAYMQLGDLQKALDDCTASLRYGSLPDAYRKQQELVKRLKGP